MLNSETCFFLCCSVKKEYDHSQVDMFAQALQFSVIMSPDYSVHYNYLFHVSLNGTEAHGHASNRPILLIIQRRDRDL